MSLVPAIRVGDLTLEKLDECIMVYVRREVGNKVEHLSKKIESLEREIENIKKSRK